MTRTGLVLAPPPRPVVLLYDRHCTTATDPTVARLDELHRHADAQGWDRAGVWVDCGRPARTPHLRPRLYDALAAVPRLRWCRDGRVRPVLLLIHTEDRLSTHPLWAAHLREHIRWAGARLEVFAEDARNHVCEPPATGDGDSR
ncbi:hypothetical protein GCM10027168_37210 [Streptomyces capparidis]